MASPLCLLSSSSAVELPNIVMSSSPSTPSTNPPPPWSAAAAASSCLHPITFWCHECDMSVSLLPSPSTLLCPHCHRHDSLVPLDSSFPPLSLTPFFPTYPSPDLVPPNPNPDPDEEDGGLDLTPRPLPSPGDSISAIPTVVIGEEFASVCAICKDDLPSGSSARRLPCSHLYHSDCIVPWLSIRNSCPLCRSPIPCPRRPCSLRRPRTPRFRVRVFEIDDEDDGDFEAAVRRIVGEPRTVAAAEVSPTQMGLEETGSAGPANSGETVSSEWPAGSGWSAGEEADALMSDVWEDAFN